MTAIRVQQSTRDVTRQPRTFSCLGFFFSTNQKTACHKKSLFSLKSQNTRVVVVVPMTVKERTATYSSSTITHPYVRANHDRRNHRPDAHHAHPPTQQPFSFARCLLINVVAHKLSSTCSMHNPIKAVTLSNRNIWKHPRIRALYYYCCCYCTIPRQLQSKT